MRGGGGRLGRAGAPRPRPCRAGTCGVETQRGDRAHAGNGREAPHHRVALREFCEPHPGAHHRLGTASSARICCCASVGAFVQDGMVRLGNSCDVPHPIAKALAGTAPGRRVGIGRWDDGALVSRPPTHEFPSSSLERETPIEAACSVLTRYGFVLLAAMILGYTAALPATRNRCHRRSSSRRSHGRRRAGAPRQPGRRGPHFGGLGSADGGKESYPLPQRALRRQPPMAA